MLLHKWKRLALFILSFSLSYLAFPNIFLVRGFSPLIFISFIPLFYLFSNLKVFQRFLIAFFWGIVFYGLLVSWIFHVSILLFISFIIILTLQPVLFSLFFYQKNSFDFISIVNISALWVASEYARNMMLGGFAWTIGYSQSFNPIIIQISQITGSYGISFIIIFINMCLYNIIFHSRKRLVSYSFLLIIVLLTFVYGYFTLNKIVKATNSTPISICTIQSNISIKDKKNTLLFNKNLLKHFNLSSECFKDFNPDLIIWPETAVADDVIDNKHINNKIKEFIKARGVTLLTGSALFNNGCNYNAAVMISADTLRTEMYQKRKLVPFVEYCPAKLLNKKIQKLLCKEKYYFSPGNRIVNFNIQKGLTFTPLICAEDGYDNMFRKLYLSKSRFMVVLLNDDRLKSTAAFYMHLQLSIMKAVSYGIPIIRSANMGISAYINAKGGINDILPNRAEGVLKVKINPKISRTIYGEYGNIFAELCLLFAIIEIISHIYRK